MSYDAIMLFSKIFPLLLFMPIFIGVTVWAYLPKNKATFDTYARIPLQDD